MSVTEQELYPDFDAGIAAGKAVAKEEAPFLAKFLRLRYANYQDQNRDVEKFPLESSTLGIAYADREGKVHGIGVNMHIPKLVSAIAREYNKGREWAKKLVYNIAKLTVEHEMAHVLSSYVAKGEEFNDRTVDIMESITTYGRHKVAKMLGKNEKAEMIKKTNPYHKAWLIGKAADFAPYVSEITGREGYPALIEDAQIEPFQKTLGRLMKSTVKGVGRRISDYFRGTGVPAYVPSR